MHTERVGSVDYANRYLAAISNQNLAKGRPIRVQRQASLAMPSDEGSITILLLVPMKVGACRGRLAGLLAPRGPYGRWRSFGR